MSGAIRNPKGMRRSIGLQSMGATPKTNRSAKDRARSSLQVILVTRFRIRSIISCARACPDFCPRYATFRQPFDMLAETVSTAVHIGAGESAKSAKTEIWLGDLDSNQD